MIRSFLEIFHYRELIKTIVSRDLKIRYKKSILGYAWSWLDPLLTMFTFILIFDLILHIKVPNFPVYLLTGLVPWMFFNNTVGQSINLISGNAGLIKRVYYPREIFPLTLTLGQAVNLVLSLLVLIPVVMAFGININAKIFLLPIPIIFLFFFAYGLALFFACLSVFLRDMSYIGPFLLRLWFYLSPIFYQVEGRIPDSYVDLYLFVNPISVILGLFRALIMDLPRPSILHIAVAFATCIAMFIFGYLFFKSNEDRMVKNI